jgi:flagellar capping protein FliD
MTRFVPVLLAISMLGCGKEKFSEPSTPTDLSDVEARLDALETALTEEQSEVDALQAENAALTEALAAMTEDVDANASAIVSNTDAGDANAASIEANVAVDDANTVAIAANTVGIEANGEAIATHAAGVATNGALISTNAAGVAANTGLIGGHGDAISDISEVSSANQLAILAMEDSAALGDYLSVDTDNHAIRFVGADVYIQNGSDDTAIEGDGGGGNLIIGYDGGDAAGKTGWHNFVIGDGHSYTESAVAFMQDANADTVVADTAEVQSSLTVYDHAYFYMAPAAFIVYDSPFYGW